METTTRVIPPNECLACHGTNTFINHHNESNPAETWTEEVYVCEDCGASHVAHYDLTEVYPVPTSK